MNENTKHIAQRIRGLRESMDMTPSEMAKSCSITEEEYLRYEDGLEDIPLGVMHQISQKCEVDVSEIQTGDSPHNEMYTITRAGEGIYVERNIEYNYHALAYHFKGRKADPYFVTISKKTKPNMPTNTHEGQEFNYVIEGEVELTIGKNKLALKKGDSIYFDSKLPHGFTALSDNDVEILVMVM